jgi:threonyl-tRNA synthetase
MLDPNDHRSLVQRLDLLHFQDEAPGMAFWHPRGFLLYRLLEEAVRGEFREHEYQEVRTPQILRQPIWEASGHLQHFAGGMFKIRDDSQAAAIKPVSCPGHIQIVARSAPSYRELPIRLAEFGVVHRDEPSGTLHGLLRLRQFTQDDGHVFCAPEQVEPEIERFFRSVGPFYEKFGFDVVDVAFATRPDDRAGNDVAWDRAEASLRNVLERLGVRYSLQPGGGAFYGPKLEFVLRDRRGREWTFGTIQLDLVMPERFELRYVDAAGERRPLIMLHRALYGSLERFLGIVLEQHGLALPPWLCPIQAVVAPIAEAHEPWARETLAALSRAGLRASLDARRETLSKRIAEAHELGVPFVAVIGAREATARSVAVRARDGQFVAPLADTIARIDAACTSPFATEN